MTKKTLGAIAALLALAAVLAVFILRSGPPGAGGDADEHGEHAHDEHAPATAAPAAAAAAAAADHAEAPPRALVTDEQLRHNGIQLATAGPARIAGTLALLGEVALNQDSSVVVTPRLGGVVQSVHASAGDRVRRGQLLAVVTSPALADQRAELLAAQKRLALARQTHDREQRLWQEQVSAEQDYLAARQALQEAEIVVEAQRQKLAALGATGAAGTQGLAQLAIRAPMAGVIIDKKVSVGEALKDDAAIFQLADLGTVWVTLVVPAQDVGRLQPGARARVKAAAGDGEAEGRLAYVGSLVSEQSRTATARVVLPNPQGLWRPGLPVTVTLLQGAADVPVAVTADAVQTLDERAVVFVRRGQQFEPVPVQAGRSDGRHIEIVQGLSAGERYAAKNSFLVKAELGKREAEHAH